jgi:hypothetical protein
MLNIAIQRKVGLEMCDEVFICIYIHQQYKDCTRFFQMQVFLEKKVDKRAIFIDERAVFGFK